MPLKKAKYTIRILIFTSIGCFLLLSAGAQSLFANMDIRGTAVNFNLNSTAKLETQQTVSQAFRISVNSWLRNYMVYARVYNSSASTSTPIPPNYLGFKLNSVTPANARANYNIVNLSTNNQLLIQSAGTSLFSPHTWTYDMILEPIGYDIMPGSYNFTILLTMTQP